MSVRVRIKTPPKEKELDGLALDCFSAGAVRDVSALVAEWLVAQGYAEPEMRRGREELDFAETVTMAPATSDDDHPRRRSTDR